MSHRRPLVRLLPFAALLAAGCNDAIAVQLPSGVDSTGGAGSIVLTLSRARVDLVTGYEPSATVQATVTGSLSTPLAWSSADTSVAIVSGTGTSARITARHAGETLVTVRAGATRAETRVVVTDPPPSPWPAIPPAERTIGGVTVRAATTAEQNPTGSPAGTVRFTVAATLANPTASPVSVQLGSCPLSFSLHAGGSWYGQDVHVLAWDQLGSGRACAAQGGSAGEIVTLAPGATRTLRTSVLSTDVIALGPGAGGVPPNSTLAVHAHVRLAAPDTDAVVLGGSMAFTLPTDALSFRATIATRGAQRDTLDAQVTLHNGAALATYLEYGACAVELLAYDASGRLVWDADRRAPWAGTYGWGCLGYMAVRTVPAGADFSPPEFTVRVPLIEMLGDSLPDGRYRFTARARLSNAPAPTVEAGWLDLALARPVMPVSRAYGFVTYTATPLGGGTVTGTAQVRVPVAATLTDAGGSLLTYPSDCVVRLAAYRDRGRRDAAPRSGAPDWMQSTTGCPTTTGTISLSRGETRTFTSAATAREILGASLPNGRYYFAAIVRAEGRLVYLSAGEASLAR